MKRSEHEHFILQPADIVTSVCGYSTGVYAINDWKYCPWCGVRLNSNTTKVVYILQQLVGEHAYAPLGVFYKKRDVEEYVDSLGLSKKSVVIHMAPLDPHS